jgi:2,3-bisphosphoglycerate-independent phosphoglycerate mutase
VTYFFNGNRSGRIDDKLEEYVEIPSDNVPFEQAPAMKAEPVVSRAIAMLKSGRFDHIRLNLANGDMVGHSGYFDATVRAMEAVDTAVGHLAAAARDAGAILLITADHGNADLMVEVDAAGPVLLDGHVKPRTSHSLNPVPFILVDPLKQWRLDPPPDAGIASVGGTLLTLFGIPLPEGYLPPLVAPATGA